MYEGYTVSVIFKLYSMYSWLNISNVQITECPKMLLFCNDVKIAGLHSIMNSSFMSIIYRHTNLFLHADIWHKTHQTLDGPRSWKSALTCMEKKNLSPFCLIVVISILTATPQYWTSVLLWLLGAYCSTGFATYSCD